MKNKKDMKNIHVLPTDKPSRLSILNNGKLNFGAEFISSSNSKAQHLYITNDEEIKEGDWFLEDTIKNLIFQRRNSKFYSLPDSSKKIILTTDQDLIKDGVQKIDDEFLEWFVQNPTCRGVEVFQEIHHFGEVVDDSYPKGFFDYKIIIPKEELPIVNGSYGCTIQTKMQETIEEFIESTPYYGSCTTEYKEGIEEGAKWQQERMYSEEDIIQAFEDGMNNVNYDDFHVTTKQWFEQFKKK